MCQILKQFVHIILHFVLLYNTYWYTDIMLDDCLGLKRSHYNTIWHRSVHRNYFRICIIFFCSPFTGHPRCKAAYHRL